MWYIVDMRQAADGQMKRGNTVMLNAGKLCSALQKAIGKNQIATPVMAFESERHHVRPTQQNIVHAVLALVYTDEQLKTLQKPDPKTASLVFRNSANIWTEVTEQAKKEDALQVIQKNFESYIVRSSNLQENQIQSLWTALQIAIRDTPRSQLPPHIQNYAHIDGTKLSQENRRKMICECIQWCLISPNLINKQPTVPAFRRKPSNILAYDPYGNDGKFSKSGAVHLLLRVKDGEKEETLYNGYNYEKVMELIVQENLLIRKVDCSLGMIDVQCISQYQHTYRMGKVDEKQFGQARDFIYQYEREFKKKIWWRDTLPNMIYHGLSQGKWTAYAIYDGNNQMVAYLDYKIRTDGNFELGTQLTAEDCRGQGFATGLINFIRLKYINTCFFTGTYEGNDSMKHVFEKMGFQETLFYDPDTGESSNRIQERINPDFPNDENKMTNSIYYHIISIMEETKFGAVETNNSEGNCAVM